MIVNVRNRLDQIVHNKNNTDNQQKNQIKAVNKSRNQLESYKGDKGGMISPNTLDERATSYNGTGKAMLEMGENE
jgi:hypothetical protein